MKPFICKRCKLENQPRNGKQFHCIKCREYIKQERKEELRLKDAARQKEIRSGSNFTTGDVGKGNVESALLSAQWLRGRM